MTCGSIHNFLLPSLSGFMILFVESVRANLCISKSQLTQYPCQIILCASYLVWCDAAPCYTRKPASPSHLTNHEYRNRRPYVAWNLLTFPIFHELAGMKLGRVTAARLWLTKLNVGRRPLPGLVLNEPLSLVIALVTVLRPYCGCVENVHLRI